MTGYRILRNGTQIGTSATTSFSDTTATPATTYSYTVTALDAAGNVSPPSAAAPATTPPDTTAPSVPGGLTATPTSPSQVSLSWTASTDDVAVTGYDVLRDGTVLTTVGSTSYINTGLTAGTTYSYTVRARDAAGNLSGPSTPAPATTPAPDTTAPTVDISAPAAGATVAATVSVGANASDGVGVVGVQFLLDGAPLNAEDTTAPYATSWDTTTAANGSHQLSARARDAAGNSTTSAARAVTVANTAPPATTGLVAGYAFDASAGTTAADASTSGISGTLANGAGWAGGKYGNAVALAGDDDVVSLGNPTALRLTGSTTISAWINSAAFPADDAAVVSKRGTGGFQLDTTIDTGPRVIGFKLTTGTGGSMFRYGATAMQANTWYHIAGVYDATARTMHVYLNGVLDDGQLQGTVAADQQDSPQNVLIGQRPGWAGFGFNGRIDDVRIYNRALTAAEVQTDLGRALGSAGSSDTVPPVVTVTAPAPGTQVADIVTVTAGADDNIGVAGVQFYVDGIITGVEDTTAPYALTWDTRTLTNGSHTLTARARDAAGNSTLSSGIAVNVANTNFFQNEVLATGFDLPTAMKFLPDGRLLVSELAGRIRVLAPPYTAVSPTPFLQISNIGSAGVQQGIYDFAFDPNFATNRFFYVFYTLGTPNRDRLSRFTANAALTGTVAGSELVLYTDPTNANAEHHGGAITFGNDGKLYFTTGEHFDAGVAQDLANPRGKIHRINLDGTVPTDNPFYDGAGPNWDSVWARGLRNPYRAFFDAPSNRLFIGDVGGNDYATAKEEINVGARGANYGWPNAEGNCSAPCTSPIYFWAHNGRDAAVTGGFVYHGTQFPASYQGSYFFADYTQNWIRRLTFDAGGNVTGVSNFEPVNGSVDGPYGDIVYMVEGPDGSLYYLDLGYSDISGQFGISKIRRIRYVTSNQSPVATAAANPTSGPTPLSVAFSSAGSADPEGQPITYAWTFGDGGTSTDPNPTHTYTQPGQYTVRLTVSDGVNTTNALPINVSAGAPPTATISAPTDGASFVAGDVITFAGDATDPDEGTLPASAFTWSVDFLHEGHVHPGTPVNGVKNGTFTIPTSGHDFSGNTRYRITLTVRDADRPDVDEDGDGRPAQGQPDVRHRTQWPHAVPRRDRQDDAVRLRHAGRLPALDRGPPADGPDWQRHVRVVVRRRGGSSHADRAGRRSGVHGDVHGHPGQRTDRLRPGRRGHAADEPDGGARRAPDRPGRRQPERRRGRLERRRRQRGLGDRHGGQHVPAGGARHPGAGISQGVYFAANIAGGANTVTVTFDRPAAYVDVRVAEYSGLDRASPLDTTASAVGTAATANSGNATTTAARTLLLGAGTTTGAFGAAGSGYTTRIITQPDLDILADRAVTAAGAYNATAGVGGAWVMQLVAFRGAG